MARKFKHRKRNVAKEFEDYFGNASDLANWQNLCADVGIQDELPSITKCRQALKSVWVNLVDFLDAKYANQLPHRFPSERALAAYTKDQEKYFPLRNVPKGSPVRALLGHIN